MIARADAALLAWHQDVVDLVQLRPAAVCRWVLAVTMALTFWHWFLKPPSGLSLAFAGVSMLALWVATLSDGVLAMVFGMPWLRCFHLGLFLLQTLAAVYLAFRGLSDPARGVSLLVAASMLAFVYFAGCRPPRPRPPRVAGALSGGRA